MWKEKGGRTQPFEVETVDTRTDLRFDGKRLVRKKPIVKYSVNEDGKTLDSVDVTARSREELDRIMRSLTSKYTTAGKAKTWQEQQPGPVDTMYAKAFDTVLTRRAVSKMAYSFLCHKIPSKEIFSGTFSEARAYIRQGAANDLASANFVHTGFMCDHARPLHMQST